MAYFYKNSVGPITCHRLTLKGKFFVSQEKAQGRIKNSVVMNLNVSANEIQWENSVKLSRCQIFGPIEKYYFQK